MHSNQTARERLRRAVDEADPDTLRASVIPLLESGDVDGLQDEMQRAMNMWPGLHDLLADTIEDVSQSAPDGEYLFCIPMLVDPDACPDMPTAGLTRALRGMIGDQVGFALVDGWVHLSDLTDLDPPSYYRMASAMAAGMAAGGDRLAAHSEGLPPTRVRRGGLGGGAAFAGLSGRPPAGARLVLGIIAPVDGPEGAAARLLDGCLRIDETEALSAGIADAVGCVVTLMCPGKPIWSAVGLEATICSISLEARMEAATAQIGRKPVVDMCITGDSLLVALSRDGTDVVDFVEMCAVGLDPDTLREIFESGSAGCVVHDVPSTMPRRSPQTLH